MWLVRKSDVAWAFTPTGAAHLFPAECAAFRDPIPAGEQDDLLAWELSANTLLPVAPPDLDDATLVAFARITHHFISNGGFLPADGLLARIDRVRHIPTVIVNGRYDSKTPPGQAWALHQAWPEAELHIVEDAGHSGAEPGTRRLIVEATNRFRS